MNSTWTQMKTWIQARALQVSPLLFNGGWRNPLTPRKPISQKLSKCLFLSSAFEWPNIQFFKFYTLPYRCTWKLVPACFSSNSTLVTLTTVTHNFSLNFRDKNVAASQCFQPHKNHVRAAILLFFFLSILPSFSCHLCTFATLSNLQHFLKQRPNFFLDFFSRVSGSSFIMPYIEINEITRGKHQKAVKAEIYQSEPIKLLCHATA